MENGDSSSSKIYDYDVIIVGGGLSGLTAAYQLSRKVEDLNILVMEATGRVGGRTWSVKMKCQDGEDSFDMGGQWIAENQTHIRALLDDLGLELYPRYEQGSNAVQFDGEFVYHSGNSIPMKWMPVMKDFTRFVDKITSESFQVSIENPETSANLDRLDSMTLEEFRKKYTWFHEYSVSLDSMLSCIFGCDASQLSVSYFMHYCKAAGGVFTAAGGSAFCVKGGTQTISNTLRDRLGANNILMNSPVTAIVEDNGITVHTSTHAQYRCRHVIVSCPPNQIGRIKFTPPLAPEKRLLATRMIPGKIIKIMITYKEAFWRDCGLSGCLRAASDQEPLSGVYDGTTYGGNAALVGFIGATRAIYWGGREESVRRAAVLEHLALCFGEQARDHIDYLEVDWTLEEYTGGGPTYPPSTGVMRYFKHLRQSSGKIHFAGTETATVCCGYMEGAVQSGVRAAKQVLYELRPEAALRTDTPLDHIRIEHHRVIKRSSNQWPALLTAAGLACLLVGGSLVLGKFKFR